VIYCGKPEQQVEYVRLFRSHLLPLLSSYLVIAAGCASAPVGPEYAVAEDDLRNTEGDVLFATEFPVTSKADALRRADESRKAGEIDKALFFYVKALNYDPQDADLLAAIGLLHQYQDNAPMAVRAYTLALQARPDFPRVLEARGLLLLAHDEFDRARSDLARAVELEPLTVWQSYNGLGVIADHRGDRVAAIGFYDAALKINPTSGSALNNRGYSKMLAGDLAGAEADLRVAAERLAYGQAWVNLGSLLARQGQYGPAVDAMQQVLPDPDALNRVAKAAMDQGDFRTALSLLEEAVRVSPTYFPEAEENLSLARLGSQNE